jgi:hypothetical protein
MSTETETAERATMSELDESRWAVISERGCEATRLVYEEASRLARQLRGEDVRGLCIITETAASRLPSAKAPAIKTRAGADSKRPGRVPKR